MLIVKKQLRNNLRVYCVVIEDWAENLWIIYLAARSSDQAVHKAIRSYSMEPSASFAWRSVKHPSVVSDYYLESLNHWNKIPKEKRPFKHDQKEIQSNQQINNNPAPEKRKRSRIQKTCQPDPVSAELEDPQEQIN